MKFFLDKAKSVILAISKSSIRSRHLMATLLCLITLVVTHAALYAYQKETTTSNVKTSLSMVSSAYEAAVRKNPNNKELWPSITALPVFAMDRSAVKVVIYKSGREVWRSGLYPKEPVPAMPRPKIGQNPINGVFSSPEDTTGSGSDYYRMRTTLVAGTGESDVFHVMVFALADPIQAELQMFNFAIWGSAFLSMIVVLLMAILTIKWNMSPIIKLGKEVDQIRTGGVGHIKQWYPDEMLPVVSSFNQLIEHESQRQMAQEKALSNLAHSLKTPIAVIQSAIEQGPYLDIDDVSTIQDQLTRMNSQVSYQLSVAMRANRPTFQKPIEIEPQAWSIASSLEKIHSGKSALCEFEIDEKTLFHGDAGDLQELLGNLLENAFKWCKSRVLLTVYTDDTGSTVIQVDDDGPGIPEGRISDIVNRGVRADENMPGHGLGLSIITDIINTYNGKLTISKNGQSGGACFKIIFPVKQKEN